MTIDPDAMLQQIQPNVYAASLKHLRHRHSDVAEMLSEKYKSDISVAIIQARHDKRLLGKDVDWPHIPIDFRSHYLILVEVR